MKNKKFAVSITMLTALGSQASFANDLRDIALDSYALERTDVYKCSHQNYNWLGKLKEEVTVAIDLRERTFYTKLVDKKGKVSEYTHEILEIEEFGDELFLIGMVEVDSELGVWDKRVMYRYNTATNEVYCGKRGYASPGLHSGICEKIKCEVIR